MSGPGTVSRAVLREGQVGPELTGNAGEVLTFGADGRTVSGAPAAGGSPVIKTQSGAFAAPIEADSQGTLTLTLAALADVAASKKLLLTGTVLVQPATGAETQTFCETDLQVQVSFDGGATFPYELPGVLAGFSTNGPQGQGSASFSYPIALDVDNGAVPTGDVQVKLTMHNFGVSTGAIQPAVALNGAFFA